MRAFHCLKFPPLIRAATSSPPTCLRPNLCIFVVSLENAKSNLMIKGDDFKITQPLSDKGLSKSCSLLLASSWGRTMKIQWPCSVCPWASLKHFLPTQSSSSLFLFHGQASAGEKASLWGMQHSNSPLLEPRPGPDGVLWRICLPASWGISCYNFISELKLNSFCCCFS